MARYLPILLLVGLMATGCSREGCTDPHATNYDPDARNNQGCIYTCSSNPFCEVFVDETGVEYRVLEGTITSDLLLTSNINWLLNGYVFVMDGVTLTIQPGTHVYGNGQTNSGLSALIIQQGGKIHAEGTGTDPIVFTSRQPNPQRMDWGGVIINGRARINSGETDDAYGGAGLYGGNDDDDNSGILKYVRIEYTGGLPNSASGLPGLSLNGVGRGTEIDFIQLRNGAEDGIALFGGTVNIRHAIVSDHGDDSFDWDDGWRGNGQFWVVQQGPGHSDRAIEGDNNGDDNSAEPFSAPTLSNLTLIGLDDGDGQNLGIRLREGTRGEIYNLLIKGFPIGGVRVSDEVTLQQVDQGTLELKSALVDNVNPFRYDQTVISPFEDDPTVSHGAFSLNGVLGSINDNATPPTSLDPWFEAAPYLGAVPASDNWTAGWAKLP